MVAVGTYGAELVFQSNPTVEGISIVLAKKAHTWGVEFITWAQKEGGLFWGHYFTSTDHKGEEGALAAAAADFAARVKRGY